MTCATCGQPATDPFRIYRPSERRREVIVCGPHTSECADPFITDDAARRGRISWRRLTPQSKET